MTGGISEPLLGGSETSLQNLVGDDRFSADDEIKDQIRDMQDNFLVRMSRTKHLEEEPRGRWNWNQQQNEIATVVDAETREDARNGPPSTVEKMKRGMKKVATVISIENAISKPVKAKGTMALFAFHMLLTALWAIIGASYYCWRLGWTFIGSLFFTVQAGYGVGFGGAMVLNVSDVNNIQVDVLYFTTFFVCCLGSLSVFSLYAFFFHEFQLHAFQSHMDKESKSRNKKMASYVSRSIHWFCGGWINDIFGLELPPVAYASLMMGFVMIVGIAVGMCEEGLTVHEAIYFTISAIQTSGLADPENNRKSMLGCTFLVLFGVPTYAAFCSLCLERIVRPYTKRLQDKILRHKSKTHDQYLVDVIRSNSLKINDDNKTMTVPVEVEPSAFEPSSAPTRDHAVRELVRRERVRSASQVKVHAITQDGLNWTEYLEVELMRMGILDIHTLQNVWENFCNESGIDMA